MTLWTACDCIGGNKAATILHVSVSTIPKALQILSVSLQHLPAGCPGQTATYAALTWCRDMQSPSYLNYKAVAHLHSRSSITPKEVLCLQEGCNGSSAPGQGRNHRLLAWLLRLLDILQGFLKSLQYCQSSLGLAVMHHLVTESVWSIVTAWLFPTDNLFLLKFHAWNSGPAMSAQAMQWVPQWI
jgi:hypothetical protein